MTNKRKFLYVSTIIQRFKFLNFCIPCLGNVCIQFMFENRISALVAGRLHWTTSCQPALLLFTFWFLFEKSKRIYRSQNWHAWIDIMKYRYRKQKEKPEIKQKKHRTRRWCEEQQKRSERNKQTTKIHIKGHQFDAITKQIVCMSLVLILHFSFRFTEFGSVIFICMRRVCARAINCILGVAIFVKTFVISTSLGWWGEKHFIDRSTAVLY